MVFTTLGSRVHTGEQHTRYMMLLSKGVVIVEMTIPSNGLAILRIRHGHRTSHHLVLRLFDIHNSIRRVIVTPCGEEQRIRIVVCQVIAGSIVNREQCLERQALQEFVHVIVDTGIELELTAYTLRFTAEVAVSNGIRLCTVRTTAREPLSVNQVE